MLAFTVIQAEYGDSFILQYGTDSDRRFILIDGGPSKAYKEYVRPTLVNMKKMGFNMDAAVLTHIDNDHVEGLLAYVEELQVASGGDLPIPTTMWENSFVTRGITETASLRAKSEGLGIPLNKEFSGKLISLDRVKEPVVFGNLKLTILGPLEENLEKLKSKWTAVQKGVTARSQNIILKDNSDQSVANLSSIVMLATVDDKTILLTGDARSDHILEGLDKVGLLDDKGHIHVDILKMPHHGSVRDMTKKFLEAVTANIYVVSADGRYGNPSFDVLSWIVETAEEQGRSIILYLTNHVEEIDKLLKTYPKEEYKYRLKVMDSGVSSRDIIIRGNRDAKSTADN